MELMKQTRGARGHQLSTTQNLWKFIEQHEGMAQLFDCLTDLETPEFQLFLKKDWKGFVGLEKGYYDEQQLRLKNLTSQCVQTPKLKPVLKPLREAAFGKGETHQIIFKIRPLTAAEKAEVRERCWEIRVNLSYLCVSFLIVFSLFAEQETQSWSVTSKSDEKGQKDFKEDEGSIKIQFNSFEDTWG